MKEIESNRNAWSQISEEHYHTFKARLQQGTHTLNHYIQKELGDIAGKDIIHLQCNTGADTIALANLGAAHVVGVDLVPENIDYARRLAADFGIANVDFYTADIMTLAQTYHEKHDIVFTSEGAIGWLPDLKVWAETIRGLLNKTGYMYVFDSHPFCLTLDETKLAQDLYEIKYPYFKKTPDLETTIGGYAAEVRGGVEAYFWVHPVSEIINSLIGAGLRIEFFNEYAENFFNSGGMQRSAKAGLYEYSHNRDKYPMSFSLKASL